MRGIGDELIGFGKDQKRTGMQRNGHEKYCGGIEEICKGQVPKSRGKALIGYGMYGRVIKGIAKADGVSLTELSERIGISRQALYKRLEGGMKVESFVECLEAMGYSLYYGKDGKVRKNE